jgi:hypothetical protein
MRTWECSKCGETVDAQLATCWNCGTHEDGRVADAGFVRDDEPIFAADIKPRHLDCLRCGKPMELIGRKRFYEGSQAQPILLGELFVNPDVFDVHACPDCRKVELFVAEA